MTLCVYRACGEWQRLLCPWSSAKLMRRLKFDHMMITWWDIDYIPRERWCVYKSSRMKIKSVVRRWLLVKHIASFQSLSISSVLSRGYSPVSQDTVPLALCHPFLACVSGHPFSPVCRATHSSPVCRAPYRVVCQHPQVMCWPPPDLLDHSLV